jgi:hypothetical protein
MAAKPKRKKSKKEPVDAPDHGWDIFDLARETSDTELAAWGRKNIKGFLGVVARDNLAGLFPREAPMPEGASFILNLDYGDFARGGTHWTGVRVAGEAPYVLYFDAFGVPPPKPLTRRAWADSRQVLYPDIQYQDLHQKNCGPRSLAVLYHLAQAAEKGEELAAFGDIGQLE